MYSIRTWCTPVEIDLCYFPICIITHNNNEFNKTLMYSRLKFCPQKSPIILPWISYRNQRTQSESYFNDRLNVSLVIQKKRTVIQNLFSFSDNSLSYKSRNRIAIHVIGRVKVSINTFFRSFLKFSWAYTLIFKEIWYFTLFR